MSIHRTRLSHALAAALSAFALTIPVLTIPAEAAAAQSIEWTFQVIADPAVVRTDPDPAAPAVGSFAKGGQVKSFAAEGAWIRFLITRPDGSLVIGYVAAADLKLLETKEAPAVDYWKVEADAYYGRGLVVRLSGGYGTIGGGDIISGTRDRYQANVDKLLALGREFETENPMSFGSRTSFDLQLLYHLSARFALGLGGNVASSRVFAESTYTKIMTDTLTSGLANVGAKAEPKLQTVGYQAIASYLLPINKRLSLRLSGGPLLAQVKFRYYGTTTLPTGLEYFYQKMSAHGFGAHASLALELNVNEQASLYLEAFGRAARISGFEGTQATNLTARNGWTENEELSGTLYAVETDAGTFLMVLSDPASAPGPCHEAVYDLLGVDLRLGVKIRF